MDDVMKAAREAATLKGHEALRAAFEFGGARPVKDIISDILDAYEAKLDETTVRVPREPTVDVLNAILRSAVSEIAVMHATGRINSIEAQTRQEAAEREARRIYRVITSPPSTTE